MLVAWHLNDDARVSFLCQIANTGRQARVSEDRLIFFRRTGLSALCRCIPEWERSLLISVKPWMEPLPKLNKYSAQIIGYRLKDFWMVLKAHFAPQARDDLARAEERHRGRNEPPEALQN